MACIACSAVSVSLMFTGQVLPGGAVYACVACDTGSLVSAVQYRQYMQHMRKQSLAEVQASAYVWGMVQAVLMCACTSPTWFLSII